YSDAGTIQGAFEKTWDIHVPNVAFRDAGLHFSLAGIQPGAPPTAIVHLTLYDPHGTPVKTGSVGLGAESNELRWSFTPGQLPLAGAYQLKATAPQPTLMSAGFASYEMAAHVSY
ncbi:MAG TPA: hypothetical protein VFH78_15935, partial [Candidatus Thermoplasmatota archaeon]|nr:hypothetical protein [Candidatus Thermoplasmatota archaeon]